MTSNSELIRAARLWEREGVGAFVNELADALAVDAAKRDSGRSEIEWGVRVGTWPPARYQTLATARHYAAHPFKGFEAYPHVVVTRTVASGPWLEADS